MSAPMASLAGLIPETFSQFQLHQRRWSDVSLWHMEIPIADCHEGAATAKCCEPQRVRGGFGIGYASAFE